MCRDVRVVVLGGGYAGTIAANILARDKLMRVTLVNPRRQFVQRIRLHQWVSDTGQPLIDYRRILHRNVTFVEAAAVTIDRADRTVGCDDGRQLNYDYLVYAVGSTGETRIPGAAEYGYSVADFESAHVLRTRLEAADANAVTVIGGGLSGVETAAELAEAGHDVTLMSSSTLLSDASAVARRAALRHLARLDVDVREGNHVAAIRPGSLVVHTENTATAVPSAVTVVAGGFAVPQLARDSGLSCDSRGRLRTYATLVSSDDTRIVGAGDAAVPDGSMIRMSCQAAAQTGRAAARTVKALARRHQPRRTQVRFVGEAVSLGRQAALIVPSHLDDSPVNAVLTGRVAALVKESVCRASVWNIRRAATAGLRRHPVKDPPSQHLSLGSVNR